MLGTTDMTTLRDSYQEHGFAVAERFFDAGEVAQLNAAIDEVLDVPDITTVAELEPGDAGVPRRIWSPPSGTPGSSRRRHTRGCSTRSSS